MEPDRVNACTFVGKHGFLFAQMRLDVNLDVDGTVVAILYELCLFVCLFVNVLNSKYT